MVRYGNPFLGRYLRYVVFLLVLGLLLPIMLIPGQTLLGLASIAAALLITIGFDLAVYWFCKYKAASFTKQEVRSMVPALITRSDWRGYFVTTDSYVLFVPILHKITFVSEWKRVKKFDMEGGYVELLVSKKIYNRSVHFIVAYPAKTYEELNRHTKEARVAVEV